MAWTRGPADPRWTSRIALRHDGSWTVVALDDPEALPNRMGTPSHLLVDGDRLWLGYDRGEFGGGLFQVDLHAARGGRWDPIRGRFR